LVEAESEMPEASFEAMLRMAEVYAAADSIQGFDVAVFRG